MASLAIRMLCRMRYRATTPHAAVLEPDLNQPRPQPCIFHTNWLREPMLHIPRPLSTQLDAILLQQTLQLREAQGIQRLDTVLHVNGDKLSAVVTDRGARVTNLDGHIGKFTYTLTR